MRSCHRVGCARWRRAPAPRSRRSLPLPARHRLLACFPARSLAALRLPDARRHDLASPSETTPPSRSLLTARQAHGAKQERAPMLIRRPLLWVLPGRLERPHPAPEAGALSTELWELARQRTNHNSSLAWMKCSTRPRQPQENPASELMDTTTSTWPGFW